MNRLFTTETRSTRGVTESFFFREKNRSVALRGLRVSVVKSTVSDHGVALPVYPWRPVLFFLLASMATCLSGCLAGVVWFGKTPDRARDVAVLQDLKGQHVRVDGVDQKTYLGIGVTSLSWSPDGARLAYPARVEGGWVLVEGGADGPMMVASAR